MNRDIVAKLGIALNEPLTEAQVVYILVEIRKLLELNGDKKNYPSLTFHCDWIAHPTLTGTQAQNIVRVFDCCQSLLDQMHAAEAGQRLEVDWSFMNSLDEIMKLEGFRSELRQYISAHELDTSITDEHNRWVEFLSRYAEVIEDCPLRCISQGLKHTDEVVLRVIRFHQFVKQPVGFQLVIEWNWTSKITGIPHVEQKFY